MLHNKNENWLDKVNETFTLNSGNTYAINKRPLNIFGAWKYDDQGRATGRKVFWENDLQNVLSKKTQDELNQKYTRRQRNIDILNEERENFLRGTPIYSKDAYGSREKPLGTLADFENDDIQIVEEVEEVKKVIDPKALINIAVMKENIGQVKKELKNYERAENEFKENLKELSKLRGRDRARAIYKIIDNEMSLEGAKGGIKELKEGLASMEDMLKESEKQKYTIKKVKKTVQKKISRDDVVIPRKRIVKDKKTGKPELDKDGKLITTVRDYVKPTLQDLNTWGITTTGTSIPWINRPDITSAIEQIDNEIPRLTRNYIDITRKNKVKKK